MSHIQTIILIILIAGILGGLTNFFLIYKTSYKKKEVWITFMKCILLSLCASITVPLFLQIIQTSILEVQKDVPFPDKNYFVLLGFCVLAAVYSKSFLENLNSKVNKLEQKTDEVERKADEAKDMALENEKGLKNTQAEFNNNVEANAIRSEPSETIQNRTDELIENIKKGYVDKSHTMLAVASGTTYEDNLKYDIYYDPISRNHGYDFKYIGLYKKWGIRAVGEIKKIVYCDYHEDIDRLIPTKNEDVFNGLTNNEVQRIKDVIKNTKYYDLDKGNKFFIIDKFYITEYTLDYPIMGKQYFWLNEIVPEFDQVKSAEDLADALHKLNSLPSSK